MKNNKNIWQELAKPFSPNEIEWRIMQSGVKNGRPWAKVLAYMDARAVMNRLDSVIGQENWSVEYRPVDGVGILCRLTVKLPDGTTRVVEDGAGYEDDKMADKLKTAISGALKRAAVVLGIGRYLYDLPETWANIHDNGKYYAKADGVSFRWNPPDITKLVNSGTQASTQQNEQPRRGGTSDLLENDREAKLVKALAEAGHAGLLTEQQVNDALELIRNTPENKKPALFDKLEARLYDIF